MAIRKAKADRELVAVERGLKGQRQCGICGAWLDQEVHDKKWHIKTGIPDIEFYFEFGKWLCVHCGYHASGSRNRYLKREGKLPSPRKRWNPGPK